MDGRLLKTYRTWAGVKLTALAAALGVSPQYVSQVENNRRPARAPFALRYLQALEKLANKGGAR